MNPLIEHALLFFISLLSNTLSAMAGGGAGLLQLPSLIFLGLPFSIALSTHKIAAVALGLGATLKHIKSKTLSVYFCLFLLSCGLPGVILGARVVLFIPDNIAKTLLGILTLGIGLYSCVSKTLGNQEHEKSQTKSAMLIGGLTLFALGFLNGSLTSGTGLFVTFWLVRWFKLTFKAASAYTMVIVGLAWNGAGAITLTLSVDPLWAWLPALLIGAVLGGYYGAYLALNYGNIVIKRVFESMTILVGITLICAGFK